MNMKLQRVIKHAYNCVVYYKDLFDKHNIDTESILDIHDLSSLPILNKKQVQECMQSLLSNKHSNVLEERTSGSTGNPLVIYKAYEDMGKAGLGLWEIRSKVYGVEVNSKYCMFYQFIFDRQYNLHSNSMIKKANSILFNIYKLEDNHLKEYYQSMMEFEPQWFLGTPSALYIFALYISQHNLPIPKSLKYIELAGEYCFEVYRTKVEEVFGCTVKNHYGCTEAYCIALECPNGNLHCITDNVMVEIVKNGKNVQEGKSGEILITCLNNYAMPLIRYAIGDQGILHLSKECGCGNSNPILELIPGRITNYIQLSNGKLINSGILYYAIECINVKHYNAIQQFFITQENYNHFNAQLVLKKSLINHSEYYKSKFIETLDQIGLCGKWDVVFVDKIFPDERTGKLLHFKNNLGSTVNINDEYVPLIKL